MIKTITLVLCLLYAGGAPLRAAPLPVLWKVPAFSFTDQDGRRFTDKDLQGRVWIADMIYTQCTSLCPLLTAQMKVLQRNVRGHDVRFLSFSVDPERDNPAALSAFAAHWNDDGSRWRLLNTGSPAALKGFLAGMNTDPIELDKTDGSIMHSGWFFLIDERGRVRGRYDSTSSRELAKLAKDAASLADRKNPAKASPRPEKETGADLVMSLGCLSCHANPKLAPSLNNLAGSRVKLEDGSAVVADEAYLRESILDPEKKLAAGYGLTMPSYRGQLSESQLGRILAYFAAAGGDGAPSASRVKAVDPVCGMGVSGGEDTPHSLFNGATYYFCSDGCRERFERDPSKSIK